MANSLQSKIATTAFAFRGYNTTNLGRTPELLAHPAYGTTIRRYLKRGSEICEEIIGRPADLDACVSERREPGLDRYAEAVALIVAADLAQVELLEEFHGVRFREAKLAYGYSLGELSAVACAGVFRMAEVLSVPVAMAEDAAALAENAVMGILFSRGPAIDEMDVNRLCRLITSEGNGTIAVSAILTPNTYLLLGQNDTIARFKSQMHQFLPDPAHIKINPERWPPLHTPIVRQRHIPDRAAVMMATMRGGLQPPCPPVLSLVTGERSYDDYHARYSARLDRSSAAIVGCGLRNAIQRHHDGDSRRPGAERDSGDVCPVERKRDSADDRPVDRPHGNARGRRLGAAAVAFDAAAQPGGTAACAAAAAHHSRRLAAGEFAGRRNESLAGYSHHSIARGSDGGQCPAFL